MGNKEPEKKAAEAQTGAQETGKDAHESGKKEADAQKQETGRTEKQESGKKTDAPKQEPANAKEAELTDALKRLQAEFENYKRRVEKEKADLIKRATGDLLAEMLTILDDFERAPIREIKDEKVRKGMEMIAGNFRKILEGEGVKPIPAEGQLDPHRHEALMWVERDDLPENTIVSVLQKGYSLNGTILRPARVSVSKKQEKIKGE